MVRTCLLLVCLSLPLCHAQELATTDDGRQLLLTTWWRLPGEPFAPLHFGIYRTKGNDWTSVAQTTDGPYLSRPFLSSDGSVTAWERESPCYGGCMILFPRSVTQFQGLTPPSNFPTWSLSLSRNARFLLCRGFFGFNDYILQDLSTGQQWTPPAAPLLLVYGVANDGSVIGIAAQHPGEASFTTPLSPNRVLVWRPGADPLEIFQGDCVYNAWISTDSSHALVELIGGDAANAAHSPREIWWIDIAANNRQRIAQLLPDGRSNFLDQANHQISNDGSRVVYFFPSQNTTLWLWQPGAGPRPLARASEGFLSSVLSGDGHVAWAFTATGRLLRIAVDTASSEEILPALPPRLTPGYAGSMAGSDMVLRAPSGISRGLHFSAGDLVYPVADDSDPDSIAVQIPWEAPPQGPPLIVKRDGNPFELALQAAADNAVPVIATVPNDHGDPFVKAAQQDFSALISTSNPAPAGSTIHTWFYNLGPLDRSVPTGVPGPSDPPAVPLAHLGCFLLTDWSSPGRALDMPFLAYAPGQIGIYQADITIPADWPNQTGLLICDINGAKTSAWIPIAP